ncbi:glycosyltransferase involved in cell wall biosynthesis [Flavobacterium sp. 90]|uniref:glycosyltransferase n=1 Tax=unclassified Flavobacterium TaxID=196869 RepID=UPI000EB52DA0|nr:MULTISPECIES: glycosyltransferase [unclassified Flavobacterium]RKR10214.1 glycosyltransferase involved in cell wall biosynthesis [Flavobacterium sp. 81]TCK54000.1 glycosyltransferase involved in cell wall biosynthesis [Flavobacterium sp. 90]
MKIIQIINRFDSGGAEKLLLETIPLYNVKGIHVDLLLLNGSELPFLKALKSQNCCTIHSLGSYSVYNPIHVLKIIPFLRKYDIAHVHLFPSQYWIVLSKIISFSKIKIIVTEHSSSNPRIKNYFFSKIDRFIYRFYYKIICITDEVYEIIQNHTKLPHNKFEVIENGINLKAIENAKPYLKNEISESLTEQDILLIQVARFSKHKDHETVIRAMKLLPDNFKLIFVGDGNLKEECEKKVQKLELENRVIFLGERIDVARLLKTADISILSSNGEGFGLVAIESMASGKPFIGSDVIGLSGLVKGAGILFEKGNERDLAYKVEKLIEDEDLRINVIDACKLKAKKFDIELMVEKHIELYKNS